MYDAVRKIFGLILGVILYVYKVDHTTDGQWGVGVVMVLDLLVSGDIVLAIMAVVGWLLASIIFGELAELHDPRSGFRPEHYTKRRTNVPQKITQEEQYSTPTSFDKPGTALHARFHEVPSPDSISKLSTSDEFTTSSILPLTRENIKRKASISLDSLDVEDYAPLTSQESSVVTDFRTALSGSSDSSALSWYSMSHPPSLFVPNMDVDGRGTQLELNQLGVRNTVSPSSGGEVKQEASPASTIKELSDEMDRTLIFSDVQGAMSMEEIRSPRTEAGSTAHGVLPAELEAELDGSVYQVSDTASLSTTLRSFELEGTCQELCRRAEVFRQVGIQARKKIDALENLRKTEIQRGNSNNAFAIKFTVREHQEEADRADRKAAKLFYRARNLRRGDQHFEIDVHYLKKEEALQMTEKALREVQLRGGRHLRVIVGKGIHSRGRIPVLKPYIQDEMRKQGIQAEVDVHNTGVLDIILS